MKKSTLLSYYTSFFKNNMKDFIMSMISIITESFCIIGMAWLVQQLLDATMGNPNALTFNQLFIISIILLIVYFMAMLIYRRVVSRFMPNAIGQYKCYLFSRISQKSIAAFRKENTSTYISAMTNDMQPIRWGLYDIFNALNCLLRMILAIILMLYYSPLMTLGALGISILFFMLSLPASKNLVKAEHELSDNNESVTACLKDFLSGFTVVKSFQAEKEMQGLFNHAIKRSKISDNKRYLSNSTISITIDGGLALTRITILLFGVFFAMNGNKISAGMVVAFIQLLDNILSPMQLLPLQYADIKTAIELINKAATNLEQNIRDEGIEVNSTLKDKISIKDLSFSYESDKLVIDHISYDFQIGKKYAIVGSSGCGKSTLLHLLIGGSKYQGNIYYDDNELQNISANSIFSITSLISQNVFLFDSTIIDNITMFKDFPKVDIDNAIQLSGLFEVIKEKGHDFICGENGCNLSGGEKQRIAIARTLLRRSQILLVDEATSSLDKETAKQVTQSILDLENVTEIIVTHSLERQLLMEYDEIIAIKSGKIIESGSFDVLMNNKGYFYSLYTVNQ